MSDDADLTTLHAEQLEELRRRFIHKPAAEATGFCLNCDAPLATGVRWCDKACTDDWERRLKASL